MSTVYSRLKAAQEAIEQAIEYIGELEVQVDTLDYELVQLRRAEEERRRG